MLVKGALGVATFSPCVGRPKAACNAIAFLPPRCLARDSASAASSPPVSAERSSTGAAGQRHQVIEALSWDGDIVCAKFCCTFKWTCLNWWHVSNDLHRIDVTLVATQWTHDAIITSLWRQNDVVLTPWWRYHCVVWTHWGLNKYAPFGRRRIQIGYMAEYVLKEKFCFVQISIKFVLPIDN